MKPAVSSPRVKYPCDPLLATEESACMGEDEKILVKWWNPLDKVSIKDTGFLSGTPTDVPP